MILKRLSAYIQAHQRVEESVLLKNFRMNKKRAAPFIEMLIRSGHIQKTVNRHGKLLLAKNVYSWRDVKGIPVTILI